MSKRSAGIYTSVDIEEYCAKNGLPLPRDLYPPGTTQRPLTDSDTKISDKKPRRSKEPNKTEAEFGAMLERRKRDGEFETVQFEAVRLKLAPGCTYEPDWMCTRPPTSVFSQRPRHHRPCFFEVKGRHKWDDAIVKFKLAREIHKWAHFEMWEKLENGQWRQMF